MPTAAEFKVFDSKTTSDFFKKFVLLPQEDKILERGSLTDLIGNETQISLSLFRENCEVVINIDLQPEGNLTLDADQLDDIGDFIGDTFRPIFQQLINETFKSPEDISIDGNVTVNGKRPVLYCPFPRDIDAGTSMLCGVIYPESVLPSTYIIPSGLNA